MNNTENLKGFPTKYWHKLDDNRIQCDLCPRACKLQEGQRGFCFVRARQDNQIILTTYGKSSGFCIDPIEKKPLNHFLPGSSVLSFGTAGCNLGCKFCQNYSISHAQKMDILTENASPKTIVKSAQEMRCKSIAFTYNEPIIFLEYAIDIAKICHQSNIRTVAVTNGYINEEPRKEFFAHMDAANVDLKGFTESFYRKCTISHLQPILDTLKYIKHHTHVWLEITTLIIPGKNDSDKEIDQLTKWVITELGPDVPIHFTAFFPAWKMQNIPSTSPATLIKARDIAIKNGIRYAYTGNLSDQKTSSTYCHQCGQCIISRSGYVISDYQLTGDGHCQFCGTLCAGVFEEAPNHWGEKRQPVIIK